MLIPINKELIEIVHCYVVDKLVANEGIIYSGTIGGCVERTFTRIYGQKRYQSIEEKAGSILYSIVHGHSFTDGNKRTGLLTTCLFLYYNGLLLRIPSDCAKYLECMADANNPKAPTEPDAVDWVKRNAEHNLFGSLANAFYSLNYRLFGPVFFVQLTKTILERNALPYVDRKKLIDQDLLRVRIDKWKKRGTNHNSS